MTTISDRELKFLLYEFLDTEALLRRPRYADHSRDIFDATIEAARQIAEDLFAPHFARGDVHEPRFVDGTALVLSDTRKAWQAFAEAGFCSAHWDAEEGGLQMPEIILRAALSSFYTANVATAAYPMLTIGAANLLRAFGSPALKARYLPGMGNGRFAGTMALTEPAQGSTLGDITTTAVPHADGSYRLYGQKMFISGGDQDLTENIIHMVLARIRGAPAGVRGISLFVVPKMLVSDDGSLGDRNDVVLAGLMHKMGWRNTTSAVLKFGERQGAAGWLLGREHHGLAHMFQMMNEARIGVGLLSACIAWRGFSESLLYARDRSQGRLPSSKDPNSPPVKLIQHADVRRMLLAQKTYAEGGLALCFYACSLFEDQQSHPGAADRDRAALLLDVLTPVVKSWPARYGCVANDMAIQVLGGAGYTRDHPVEQLYRDQRLNLIHEGVEAIHALDLLGRKVTMNNGEALQLLLETVRADIRGAQERTLLEHATALELHLQCLAKVTSQLVFLQQSNPDLALANANVYLDAFGRVVLAWMWLKQGQTAQRAVLRSKQEGDLDYYRGKLQAMRFFFEWELPAAEAQWRLLEQVGRSAYDMRDAWFG